MFTYKKMYLRSNPNVVFFFCKIVKFEFHIFHEFEMDSYEAPHF